MLVFFISQSKEHDSLMQNLDICTWEFREYFVESKYANVFLRKVIFFYFDERKLFHVKKLYMYLQNNKSLLY